MKSQDSVVTATNSIVTATNSVVTETLWLEYVDLFSNIVFGITTIVLGVIGLRYLKQRTKIGDEQLKTSNKQLTTSNKQLTELAYQNTLENLASKSEALMFAALETLSNYTEADEKRRKAICAVLCARFRQIGEEAKKESAAPSWLIDLRQKLLETLTQEKFFENFRINLDGAFLSHLIFTQINLEKANKVNLEKANLEDVDLRYSTIKKAHLSEAILKKANLEGVDLQGADLQRADLRGADLRGANLQEAILLEANLDGAILERAGFKKAELQYARIDNKTNIDEKYLEKNYEQRPIDTNCYHTPGLLPPNYCASESSINKSDEEIWKNNPRIIFPKDNNIEDINLYNKYKDLTEQTE